MVPGGRRPLDQANHLEPQACLYRQPVNRIFHHRHLLSLLSPIADTEGRRLSTTAPVLPKTLAMFMKVALEESWESNWEIIDLLHTCCTTVSYLDYKMISITVTLAVNSVTGSSFSLLVWQEKDSKDASAFTAFSGEGHSLRKKQSARPRWADLVDLVIVSSCVDFLFILLMFCLYSSCLADLFLLKTSILCV